MASVPNNGPLMAGCIWMLAIISLFFLLARIYAKLSRSQRLWWDDYILIASWVFLLAEVSTTQAAITLGYGKHLRDINPTQNIISIAIIGQSGVTVAVFATNLSKISFGVTLLRLVQEFWRWAVWFAISTLVVFAVPNVVLVWTTCAPLAKSFDDSIPGTCIPRHIPIEYGFFTAAWAGVMDYFLAMVPWILIWNLQMRPAEKVGVGVAMSLGILSGTVAIIKTVYIQQTKSDDFSFDSVDLTIWTATETASAIVAASIPVLRVFVRDKSSSRRYGSNRYGNTYGANTNIQLSRLGKSTLRSGNDSGGATSVWITSTKGDGDSDKSILGEETDISSGGIVRTNTFIIHYGDGAEERANRAGRSRGVEGHYGEAL